MQTLFKIVGWVMAAIFSLLVWNTFPETRAIIGCGIVVALICYGLSIVVGVAVKRYVGEELREIRHQGNAAARQLELIDRRLTLILRDALEQRQAAKRKAN